MQMINRACFVSKCLVSRIRDSGRRVAEFLAGADRTLNLIALLAVSEALVERTCASENLAFAFRRAHIMKSGIFTIVFIRQVVIQHQVLNALLFRAFGFLL